jgi:hypothetical protein
MIGHKLSNKTKSATVAEPKLFHQLNNPFNAKTNVIGFLPFGAWLACVDAVSC